MRTLLVLVAAALVGCSGQPLPTYQQLQNYPLNCKKKYDQVSELEEIQRLKFFNPNPENRTPEEQAYYALLREHIWWFAYHCDQ